MRLMILFIVVALSCMLLGGCKVKQTDPAPSLKVLAPDFLEGLLEPAVQQFGAENSIPVTIVYEYPDSIASRIRRDGTFDLFFAVGQDVFKPLTRSDFLYHKRYACPFRLVMAVVGRAEGPVITKPDDLKSDHIRRIVVVDPERAYEGRLARYILKKCRIWNRVESKLILARSSDQAYSYMKTGEADAAVIFESSTYGREGLIIAGKLEKGIDHRLTVCGAVPAASKNTSAAQAFLDLFDSNLCEMYKRSGIYQID